ncbi:MAG: YajG family lipoprotein [Nitrospinales bacterium]
MLIAVSGLASCANTQHKIAVEPELYVKQVDFGKGNPISLKVVDKRSQFAILSKKAAPNSGLSSKFHKVTIVPSSSIADPIYRKVKDGLKQSGFRPLKGSNASRKLLIEVVQWRMGYQHKMTAAKVNAKLITAIRVTAGNSGKIYKNIYKTSSEKSSRMLVGKFKNEEFANTGLSIVLQKIFEDKKLLIFLAE